MIPTPETSPFDDDDLARLEALLYDHVGDGDGMPLEAVDGLFSALIVGPEPVLPDEALPQVLGDGEAAPELVELLRKLWDHITWRVRQPLPVDDDADAAYELMPFVGLPELEDGEDDDIDAIPRDFPVGALWAAGFLQGMSLRADAWTKWMDADADLALDIQDLMRMSVATPEHAAEMELDADDLLDFDDRWGLLASVPELLQNLDLMRFEAQRPREPIRRDALPGRNDPCPCGSGQKWKKCCGSTVH